MAAVDPLPAGSRLLHIGPQKTGSTALQGALHQARPRLRELGVVFPGPTPRPWAAFAAGLGFPTPRGAPEPEITAWHRLLAQLDAPGVRVACISHEALGRAGPAQAQRVLDEVGGPRPHVVAVARSYDRLLPSQWQQRVKARLNLSYEEWLRIVLVDGPYSPIRRNLWIPHDTAGLARRWGEPIGVENFTVVIASEQDRLLLLRTTEQLLGVPDGLLELVESQANRSLTYPEVELLRGLNEVFERNEWSDEDYFDLVVSGIIPALITTEPDPHADPIPPLPPWASERIAELSTQRVAALQKLGVRVVGDLDSLLPQSQSPPLIPRPSQPVPSQELALRALEGMAQGFVDSNTGRNRRARIERRTERQAERWARKKARESASLAESPEITPPQSDGWRRLGRG